MNPSFFGAAIAIRHGVAGLRTLPPPLASPQFAVDGDADEVEPRLPRPQHSIDASHRAHRQRQEDALGPSFLSAHLSPFRIYGIDRHDSIYMI